MTGVLGLGHGVAFKIHFEPMSRFQWLFGLWIDWTLDMRVLGLVDSLDHVEIALAVFFLPALVSSR